MIVRRKDRSERPGAVRRVLAVGIAALLLAGLLNAESILERSKQKPFGAERDAWVAVWTPIAWVAGILQLDHPHAWIDSAIGRDDSPGAAFPTPTLAPGETPAPTPTPRPGETPSPEPTPATPTPEPWLPVRSPSAEAPLRLWAGGDSQAQVFGESLLTFAAATGLIDAVLDYRISSGLTRPDYFNWPAHLAEVAASSKPEVMVIVFGANDSQGIETAAGEIYQPLEDGWRAEYRLRVAATMDLLRENGRLQVWVGQPIAASSDYTARMADINTILSEEADARPWVRFFDTWNLFTGPDGGFATYLTDDNGEVQAMRQADGIHLTRPGGDRLARALLDFIGDDVAIGPPYSE